MMEAAVVVGLDWEPLYWHVPPGRSSVALPDTRDLWDVIWENRRNLLGIAHSHPGSGVPGPSHEDITTFAAIESGLGRDLRWWITSRDRLIELRCAHGHDLMGWERIHPKHDYSLRRIRGDGRAQTWLPKLRELSYEPEVKVR